MFVLYNYASPKYLSNDVAVVFRRAALGRKNALVRPQEALKLGRGKYLKLFMKFAGDPLVPDAPGTRRDVGLDGENLPPARLYDALHGPSSLDPGKPEETLASQRVLSIVDRTSSRNPGGVIEYGRESKIEARIEGFCDAISRRLEQHAGCGLGGYGHNLRRQPSEKSVAQ